MSTKQPTVLESVLHYHALGLSVFPIKPIAKEPSIRSWTLYQTERAPEAQVKKWFKDSTRNVAIVMGEVSGNLVVRDFDTMESYEKWALDQPNLAKTLPTVSTRRGRHVYARADLASLVPALGRTIVELGDGELRCGGYVVAPPSVHPSGVRYGWCRPLDSLPPVVDVHKAGFIPSHGEDAEDLENRENKEGLEGPRGRRTLKLSTTAFEAKSAVVLDETILELIRQCVPAAEGQRHMALFRLARALKSIPAFEDHPASSFQDVVREWHRQALPFIHTKDWETSWWDFSEGYEKVKYKLGKGPMARVVAAAKESNPPAIASGYDRPETKLLIALCRELQRNAGKDSFYLSCRVAGKVLQVDHAQAARSLKGLCRDGVIERMDVGERASWQAFRYRYLHD